MKLGRIGQLLLVASSVGLVSCSSSDFEGAADITLICVPAGESDAVKFKNSASYQLVVKDNVATIRSTGGDEWSYSVVSGDNSMEWSGIGANKLTRTGIFVLFSKFKAASDARAQFKWVNLYSNDLAVFNCK